MKKHLSFLGFFGLPCALLAVAPLTESSFTQVINDVKVLATADRTVKPAKLDDLFKSPDLVQTGADSLAELTAQDRTVTRIGANTVFAFEPKGRSIRLEKGSVLFHSPTGKGGGTIRTGGASASVLGTTIVVTTTSKGGFKAIVLEGKGEVRLPNGDFRILNAGQLVYVLQGSKTFGPVLTVNLDKLVRGARLVNGFQSKLPSLEKIEIEVEHQNELLESGHAEDTHLLAGGSATENEVEVSEDGFIPSVLSAAVLAAMRTDAAIGVSTLDPKQIFLDPFGVALKGLDETTFRGFVAQDISITTPTINLAALTTGYAEFDILATGKLEIHNSVTFTGNTGYPHTLKLAAVDGIEIENGSVLTANNVGNLYLESGVTLDFENIGFHSNSGGVTFESAEDMKFNGGSISGSFIHPEAFNIEMDGTALALTAGKSASYIDLLADNNITIDAATFNGLGASSQLAMSALETLDVRNTSVSGFGFINMSARTIILQNINFAAGTLVALQSQNGLLAPNPNTGQSVLPGYVNYINNVTYNGTLLTSTPHPNITLTARP